MSATTNAQAITVRPIEPRDRDEIHVECARHWGSTEIWSLGHLYHADELPGFVAEADGRFAGFVTVNVNAGGWQCEVITLSSRTPGAGTALLAQVEAFAHAAGCKRLYLTTTNDNTWAMRFYQRRGWRLARLHAGIVDRVREVEPEYPLLGIDGIRIRDEIEFERWLT